MIVDVSVISEVAAATVSTAICVVSLTLDMVNNFIIEPFSRFVVSRAGIGSFVKLSVALSPVSFTGIKSGADGVEG